MNQNYNQNYGQMPINTQQVNKSKSFTKMYLIGIGIFIIAFSLGLVLGKVLFGKDTSISNTTDNTINNNGESTSSNENVDGVFLMGINETFTITGRGTVVAGEILRGKVKIGDDVQVIGMDNEVINTKVTGIEAFRKQLEEGKAGEEIAVLLDKNVKRDDLKLGQVLAKPNSIKAYKKFNATIHLYSKSENGNVTSIQNLGSNFFSIRDYDIKGTVTIANGVNAINPGEDATISVNLANSVALEKGVEFLIKNNGEIIGKGTVSEAYY